MELTKEKAIELHKELWTKMADRVNKCSDDDDVFLLKMEVVKEMGFDYSELVNCCFLCTYCDLNCWYCPGFFNKKSNKCMDGLYNKFCDAFTWGENELAHDLALEIANHVKEDE